MLTVNKQIRLRDILALIFLILLLPVLIFASQHVIRFLTQATGTPANIIINRALPQEELKRFWGCFAQGGEESKNMLAPIASEIKQLAPTYIRIDHLYDHHSVVKREHGQLVFDFSQIDAIVKTIRDTGGTPLLSLSYMPAAIAKNGDILENPSNWNEWSLVVQKTIERYSGKNNLNISHVYYEVWNEPDLFGKWKTYGDKNYLTLYHYGAIGAQNAQNVNDFKIGGPATTKLYENWITALAEYVIKNNLRLDFVSWHLYDYDPTQFASNTTDVTRWLFAYPQLTGVPRLITEWGFDPENHAGYDGNLAAAHAIATIRQALDGYNELCAFELVDGPSPDKKTYWGRWGLLTHPDTGKIKKPRFTSFQFLNKLTGVRLSLSGEGSWVTGIAALDNTTIRVLLTNYDRSSLHAETVPLHFQNLDNDTYTLSVVRPGQNPLTKEFEVTNTNLDTEVIMTPNSFVLLELTQNITNPFLGN